MEFLPSNLGVIVCDHVFRASRSILLVAHVAEGWNFACGQHDHRGTEDFHNVGVGHLTARDPSVNECANLECGYVAERSSLGAAWVRQPIPEHER
jgi:hypothetical protein